MVLVGVMVGAAGHALALTFTEFPLPTRPLAITTGPDGARRFTLLDNAIGRITTAGVVVTEYAVPGGPLGITVGPDGALWFTEQLGPKIGRFSFPALRVFPATNTAASGQQGGPFSQRSRPRRASTFEIRNSISTVL